ncbi:MAG: Lrp/AsnC family transcriptional regulator [Gammaproteobacteria bacterium]|jgi:DNA-binding Lrp family transcriptional regulator|nr:Lrp/AsnC family transcriptional regulator [Gammaproteobacteria bacterium]MCP4881195.1 Lrp/AsnC family transcriptional regulator [Gammaproteobacteria bacterium]MDP6166551.1 Lrp/AsnC family transcriptional regulator [Gammaproteobacteria bacterium]
MDLTQRDILLLQLLQKDCRVANADLADQVGMSASACWRRIKAFEDAGVITRYGVVLNEANLGLQFRAIVNISLSRHDPEGGSKFVAAMHSRQEVVECYATTGREDYSMQIICKDISAYNEFLESFLFKLGVVKSVHTNVILRDIKRHGLL